MTCRSITGRTFVICQPKFSGSPFHQEDPQPIHTIANPLPPSLFLLSMRFSMSCNLVLILAIDSFCFLAPISLTRGCTSRIGQFAGNRFFWHFHSSTQDSVLHLAYSWYQVSTSSHSALKEQPKVPGEGALSFLAWFTKIASTNPPQ